ncbi:MAG: hypothetical protein E6R07_05865 [Nevskiaceae bacterium]|nr:MAG: hypothetical protein E6R07_05865 [Nevskiaceae bacterium]
MLKELKDSALSLAFKAFLNEKFKDYGEVLDCEFDTTANRLSLHALLRGESAPVSAAVERYKIKRDVAGAYIVLHELSSSREWLTRLLNALFAGKRYAVPAAVGALL